MRDASLERLIIDAARSELSPPAPKASLESIMARRAAGERIVLPLPDASAARQGEGVSSLRRSLLWTVALIAGTAVLAAALPGSPLRRWIERRGESATPRASVVAAAVAPAVAPANETVATPDVAVSGVTVPIADAAWVSIEPGSDSLRVRFRLTDGRELEVRGIGGAARAIFRPRAGGIGVTTSGGGEIQVDVPRSARAFELRVGGVTYLAKDGARLRVLAPDADTVGADLVFQTHPSRSAKP